MTREEMFDSALDQLLRLLRKKALTARQIADELKCSKVTVYKRIRALQERGHKFRVKDIREGSTGPLSTAYKIKK